MAMSQRKECLEQKAISWGRLQEGEVGDMMSSSSIKGLLSQMNSISLLFKPSILLCKGIVNSCDKRENEGIFWCWPKRRRKQGDRWSPGKRDRCIASPISSLSLSLTQGTIPTLEGIYDSNASFTWFPSSYSSFWGRRLFTTTFVFMMMSRSRLSVCFLFPWLLSPSLLPLLIYYNSWFAWPN